MKEQLTKTFKGLTKHDNVQFTSRGNQAIFLAFAIAKSLGKTTVLIPDQGGWLTYKTYPQLLGLNIQEIKTDYGIIDLEDLQTKTHEHTVFIATSFAGYFAEQPIRDIANICKNNGTLFIEDASGAITDETLCDGTISDIIVASFGDWKVMNVGYGGFISVRDGALLHNIKDYLSLIKVNENLYKDLEQHVNNKRLQQLLTLQQQVKEELKDYKIYHKDKRGLNVITEHHPDVIAYCKKNNYAHVECPKYIRIQEKAISIELKRLP